MVLLSLAAALWVLLLQHWQEANKALKESVLSATQSSLQQINAHIFRDTQWPTGLLSSPWWIPLIKTHSAHLTPFQQIKNKSSWNKG